MLSWRLALMPSNPAAGTKIRLGKIDALNVTPKSRGIATGAAPATTVHVTIASTTVPRTPWTKWRRASSGLLADATAGTKVAPIEVSSGNAAPLQATATT